MQGLLYQDRGFLCSTPRLGTSYANLRSDLWNSAKFSSDGRLLAYSNGGVVAVVDVATWTQQHALRARTPVGGGGLSRMDFAADNKFVACGGWDGGVVWNLETESKAFDLPTRSWCVRFLRNPALLAVGGRNGVRILQRETGESVLELGDYRSVVRDISFSRDGKTMLTAGADQTARIWHLDS